jgi:hypothetical protein
MTVKKVVNTMCVRIDDIYKDFRDGILLNEYERSTPKRFGQKMYSRRKNGSH